MRLDDNEKFNDTQMTVYLLAERCFMRNHSQNMNKVAISWWSIQGDVIDYICSLPSSD